MRDEPARQERLRILARTTREQLSRAGFVLPPGDSPIIPIILGEEERTLDAAKKLRQRGLLVMAIRPPTVPPGSSRLRVSLSCEHTDAEIQALIDSIMSLNAKP
jgi:7-keto-8-aminopelargonate synthetase-like enzyme